MRLFVAVDLPEEIKEKVGQVLKDLASVLSPEKADIKWVKPEQIHFTLKFLGECPEERIPEITQTLDAAVKDIKPFTLRLGGLGVFPDKGPSRVIWLGLQEGKEAMSNLALRTELALEPLGFASEDRPFSAHLTLGRVKSTKHPDKIRSLLDAAVKKSLGVFSVGEVVLYRSILSPTGPTYSILHVTPLM